MINGRRRTRIIIWAVALILAALAAASAFAQTSSQIYVGNGNTGTGAIITAPVGTCATCVSIPTSAGASSPLASTNISGTVTTGGTFQQVLAQNSSRKGCLIENPTTATEALYIYASASGTASTTNAFSISPGSAFSCSSAGGTVIGDAVQVSATTTGHVFVGNSQ